MNLTDEAKKQLLKASSNSMLGHTIFIRTQYDVLRRVRAYWIPRFLIHKERIDQLRLALIKKSTFRILLVSSCEGFKLQDFLSKVRIHNTYSTCVLVSFSLSIVIIFFKC